MIQGTGSHVGKSVLTAAICRICREDGINVAPFKSQNMALNSFVTEEGGEMGRAQVVQAEAAGLKPHVDMNPILLKPQTDVGSQVIIHGKVYGKLSASDYHLFKEDAIGFVKGSYNRLSQKHDLIVIEGAGSPAEVNLRENDIANMGTAHMADAPVILVGDIDRGGVFASLVGTVELLDEEDRRRVKGFIINKFRGDISLLKPGLEFLEKRTGLPVLGVIPYFKDVYIQEEDGVKLDIRQKAEGRGQKSIEIAVIHLPRISNFTDFDPFMAEEDVHLRYVKQGERIGKADIIIIPGSKSTIADLVYIRNAGHEDEIRSHLEGGGTLIGICGGYQMLGKVISDPHGVEGGGEIKGLGYLDIETVMEDKKSTCQVMAEPLPAGRNFTTDSRLRGYEIHMGNTTCGDGTKPLFEIVSRNGKGVNIRDGAVSGNGSVWGTYIHGIFDNDRFRRSIIDSVKSKKAGSKLRPYTPLSKHSEIKEEGFKKLAELVRSNLDMKEIYNITGLQPAYQSGRRQACN